MTLIERLEAAEAGSRELDWRIQRELGIGHWPDVSIWPPFMELSKADKAIPPYTTSLDAALTLTPEGWVMALTIYHDCSTVVLTDDRVNPVRLPEVEATSASPALALCSAALRARGQS